MNQATHVAVFGGSELLLVQLDRTYHLDRISFRSDRAGYFTKGLLITCSFVEVCNFMPSAGVTV